jgi:dihydroorotate dehydrogenase
VELRKIISKCMDVNEKQALEHESKKKPILVKVAPDMSLDQLEQIVTVAIDEGCSGIVATNTTISRPDEATEDLKLAETGGMSGKPLRDKSTEFISHIYRYTNGKFPIVGVGGIMNAQDAWEKITAGASLIQAYSGFVFEGPSLSKQIIKGLHKKLKEHNLTNIQDAVGLIHRSK